MSNTTITTRSAAENAALREVRRLQAEAQRLQRERQRLAQTSGRIAQLDARAQQITTRLDEAASGLPDLQFRPLAMPAAPVGTETDATALERYAQTLDDAVTAYERAAREAIDHARQALQRRHETARLWRDLCGLEDRLAQLHRHCAELARHTGEPLPLVHRPARPDTQAALERVQAHHQAVQALVSQWEARRNALASRQTAQAAAARTMGHALQARTADAALQAADQLVRNAALKTVQTHVAAELSRRDMAEADLPAGLREQLTDVQALAAQGDTRDLRAEVSVWLAREAAQRDGVRHADALLLAVPEGVNEDEALRQRWTQLAAQLQRVMNGMDPMTPHLLREHEQLGADAQRHVNLMLARADWVAVMTAAGCEVLECEDGGGLVVLDLDHPEIYLEAQEYVDDQGTFAVSLELKADKGTPISDEGALTDAVCRKLQQAAGHSAPKVSAHSEVVERKSRITRSQRPAVRRAAALQQPLSG